MKARVLALYLPQYHPIPENDEWWGKGFTEWTNVGKAKRYFRTHYQPRVPADLGYYDLRLPEARQAQADMARTYGVEGFLYWHYWFGNGKQLLERPFHEVVTTGQPDFPFALAWANETWKGFAHGLTNRNVLIEQQYPGDEDYVNHFYSLLSAFQDKRYITVNGRLLFMIYKPSQLPDPKHFIELWRQLAEQNGLPGFYFVAHYQSSRENGCSSEQEGLEKMLNYGFDAVNFIRLTRYLEQRSFWSKVIERCNRVFRGIPLVYAYRKFIPFFSAPIDADPHVIPTIIPGWDHTPRSKKMGLVMTNATPELFEKHVTQVLNSVQQKPLEQRLVFIKSWNEWAEGNYMEPDLRWGKRFLEVLKNKLEK